MSANLFWLDSQLVNVDDSLQLAKIMKEVLPDLPMYSEFLIVEIDSELNEIGELLSGGVDLEPAKYRLKKMPGIPTGDVFFDSLVSNRFPVEYPVDQVSTSPVGSECLGRWIESGAKKMLVTALVTDSTVNGLLFLFSRVEEEPLQSHLIFVNAMAKHMSAALGCLRVVRNVKDMTCQHSISAARRISAHRDREKSTLINISNDMSAIRNKQDLLRVLHERLKSIFNFSHTLTTLSDASKQTYTGLIFDSLSISKKRHPDYQRICDQNYSWNDPMMKLVFATQAPVVFDLDDPELQKDMPEWVRMNYDSGIREVVMTILNSGTSHIGAFVIFSEEKGTFKDKELGLIRGISSQLANAVANILANEEILEREKEKTILLSLSDEVSMIRNKEGLINFIRNKLRKVLPINHVVICAMDEDQRFYSTYLLDPDSDCRGHKDYDRVSTALIPVRDEISEQAFHSEHPMIYDLQALVGRPSVPEYLKMNYECGMKQVVLTALSIGGRKTGLLVIFTKTSKDIDQNRLRLIQGVSSQMSTAINNIFANEKIERQFAEISEYKLQLENMNGYLQEEIQTTHNFSEIIGTSDEMQRVFHLVSQVAESSSSVLILGETGTGKELIARAIHGASPRNDKAMVKVNCAALPVNLIESELFGHERGSFTGAVDRRIGKFELANGSTLFLDEIGELPLDLQAKLLRAIQEKEIERVGGRTVIKTNVRIIAATSRDLEKEVKEGLFRSDLYFRLNVFPITVPPLRSRKEDIPTLAAHFLTKYAKRNTKDHMSFSNKVMKELVAYQWPGNVRELEHMIERSLLLTNGPMITQVSLPITTRKDLEQLSPDTVIKTIEEVERDHILMVLRKTKGKISGAGGAAALLNIPATTLSSKMLKLKIKRNDARIKS
jgi:formate hydrogenlyase transcriptional activator